MKGAVPKLRARAGPSPSSQDIVSHAQSDEGGTGKADPPLSRSIRCLAYGIPLMFIIGLILPEFPRDTRVNDNSESLGVNANWEKAPVLVGGAVSKNEEEPSKEEGPRDGMEIYAGHVDDSACVWRNDTLRGTCFGLRCRGKGWESISTSTECSKKCCNLKDKCITWQFRKDIGCCIGGAVRHGHEGLRSVHWCEPTPPSPWTGHRLKSRGGGRCEWGDETLKGQCFGLGPVKPPKSKQLCADGCCKDPDCTLWQWRDDKGCFWGKTNNCLPAADPVQMHPYIGKRKPVDKKRVMGNGWLRPEKN
ncbi:hypothetical protein AAMO2058_000045500 [Amorphochlora amoebiformis]